MSHCFEWGTGKEIQPNIGHNFGYDTAVGGRKKNKGDFPLQEIDWFAFNLSILSIL